MKNNRIYIFLIIAFIVFFFLVFLLYGKDSIRKEKEEVLMLVGDNTIWSYSQNHWYDNSDEIEKYNWKKFKVYLDGKYSDEYYVWYDEKWYIFDKDKEPKSYQEKFLAMQSNYDIKVKQFNSEPNNNQDIVSKYLKDKGLSSASQLTTNTKTTLDIDNDNKDETIYIISNAFPLDFNPEKIFSFVFIEKDGKIIDIFSSIENNTYDNGVKPYIESILDIDEDGKYEMIIAYAGYSITPTTHTMYKLDKDSIIELISNQ